METIEAINRQLVDHFGRDVVNNSPIWRIVWSDDQLEKRIMDHTPTGVHLLFPQAFEVPKYPYIQHKYVLERLVLVPDVDQPELLGKKISYEPMWTFESASSEAIIPTFIAAKFVVDTVYAAMGKKSMAVYVDSEKNTTPEGREQRIAELHQELFGDDTEVSDALHYKEGVVVPPTYEKKVN